MATSTSVSGGYFPVYPHHGELPDPEIRSFITNFYRISDKPDSNELWVSYFLKDATVTMGNDTGTGEQEIRELRGRMWNVVAERKHVVNKVFPGSFQDADGAKNEAEECELMLFGDVHLVTKEGQAMTVPWAGHGVLRSVGEGDKKEWKFAKYRVWLQR